MEITEVKIMKITEKTGKIRAICSVLIDNCYYKLSDEKINN